MVSLTPLRCFSTAVRLCSIVGFASWWLLGCTAPPDQEPTTDATVQAAFRADSSVSLGPRPAFLVGRLDDGPLKKKLESCLGRPARRSSFSIGHRGAPMQFPEHTRESYEAAAAMGAGILECDVTFTRDRELVCRHSPCDLHTTTNILAIPELAAKCAQPFVPADPESATPASARCCTSDLTLAEFKRLCGKMDAHDPTATTVEQYLGGTAPWRTDLYASCGTVVTHAESIELFRDLGARFAPELKSPEVDMPFEGTYSQEAYAQQLIDEYRAAGVPASDVFAQSFNLGDVLYWISREPDFGRQAVYLDDRTDTDPDFEPTAEGMAELVESGVQIVAPPMWVLLSLDHQDRIVPSDYARLAREAGLDIITWTLERSGPLQNGGGWYFQSVREAIDTDGDVYTVLDVLAQEVGILGIFSDWPATSTFYANCMDLR